ncbi:hypothetical protein T265_04788 [Opisthorchis viverrini]|uniref:Alpha-1,3/1,6-mannosyltransferase ALG2 n=1 Tax=Opisthorchis viverrini TaxID=6198 RepID=A0A074ZR84_OPIVI|nr:hypothetical protein T265_04788 [Opisthorchis viverrini]KER28327.1 hypothetical protein T265_04788 [Opisthorchis viverrini]
MLLFKTTDIAKCYLKCMRKSSTRFSDNVNSSVHLPAGVVRQTFPSLAKSELEVLYPVANTDSLRLPSAVVDFDDPNGLSNCRQSCRNALPGHIIPKSARFVFVSINRYERKKNLSLALFALSHLFIHWDELVDSDKSGHAKPSDVHLVLAGGYDTRVAENVEYHKELTALADELKIGDHVTFVRSCPSEVKTLLISSSDAVLYTPDREHFGIVPVEAMFLYRPVIALDSGGPRETVLDGSTGFLCRAEPEARLPGCFAVQLARFLNDPSLVSRMGKMAHRRVVEHFSCNAFRKQLCDIISHLSAPNFQ